MRRHDEIAELIIRRECLAFALAAAKEAAGEAGDVQEARRCLKAAICAALAAEWDHVTEWALAGDL